MSEMSRNKVFTFGKYKGKTIGDVFMEDPNYILWCCENIVGFEVSDYIYYTCIGISIDRYDDYGCGYEDWKWKD